MEDRKTGEAVPAAAVVVTHNAAPWIDSCLESLLQSDHPVSVIVVDNASQDDTTQRIREHYPGVTLLENRENTGFARANNQGMRIALENHAQYLFLLNQDATTAPDTIGHLISLQQKNPGYGVLSPMHLNGDGTALDTKFCRYSLQQAACKGLLDRLVLHRHADLICPVNFVNAAAWLVSRKCLEAAGGFHPAFFMYAEDGEFLRRARHHGFRAGVCPGVTIRHHRRQEEGAEDNIPAYLSPGYLENEVTQIMLFPGNTLASKKKALRLLQGRTLLRAIYYRNPKGPSLIRHIRRVARRLNSQSATREAMYDLWRDENPEKDANSGTDGDSGTDGGSETDGNRGNDRGSGTDGKYGKNANSGKGVR